MVASCSSTSTPTRSCEKAGEGGRRREKAGEGGRSHLEGEPEEVEDEPAEHRHHHPLQDERQPPGGLGEAQHAHCVQHARLLLGDNLMEQQ